MQNNRPTEFPRIPQDTHSKSLLQSVSLLGAEMLKDKDEKARKLGKVLLVLGTAPHQFDFIYFLIHNKTSEMRTGLCDWYNSQVHSKGQEHMLKVANRETKGLEPWFNQFQLTFFSIKEKGKVDPNWTPMADIQWAIWSSFFSDSKFNQFMDMIERIVLESKSDFEELQLASLN